MLLFYSIDLFFIPRPYCLDYCSSVVCFEIRECGASSFVLKSALIIQHLLLCGGIFMLVGSGLFKVCVVSWNCWGQPDFCLEVDKTDNSNPRDVFYCSSVSNVGFFGRVRMRQMY